MKVIIGMFSGWLLFTLVACSQHADDQTIRLAGKTMGTSWHVTIARQKTDKPIKAAQLKSQLENELAALNQLFSTYIQGSEVSRFNASHETHPYEVSSDIAKVVQAAQRVSQQTSGAFDITVAPLVDLWGFGKTLNFTVPDRAQIDRVRKQVGFTHLQVQQQPPRLTKNIPQLQIDLSAIAKGFAVDRLVKWLHTKGIHNYLVEIGGEVKVSGINPLGQRWQIAVEKPLSNTRTVQQILSLDSIAVATSGDYHNFFEQNGIRYSHTIDPRTGRPVRHQLASVTVLHKSCMLADAYATAIMVMGEKKGLEFARQHHLQVLLLVRKEQAGNDFDVVSTLSPEVSANANH